MRARLEKHFGNKSAAKAITIGTFHSICLQILLKQNGKNNMPIIDEADALSIVKDILNSLCVKNPPRDVLRGISLTKNGSPSSEESTKVPPGVYDLYNAQLKQYGVLDYDDILLDVLELFKLRGPGDTWYKNLLDSFSHPLVDEFQDINPIQYQLFKEWSRNSAGIFIIGNPDQSIYGFRGSDPRCFEQFFEDYPHVRQVNLTRNYRSTPEIIHCAKASISKKTVRGHALTLEAERESGLKVRLLETEDAFSEALFVAKEINRMVGGIDMLDAQVLPALSGEKSAPRPSRGFSDISVLYRTNRQADILEQCLQKEGIPYIVAGKDEFLSEPEIRRTIAFFRFLLNPEDLISLRTCLKLTNLYQADLVQEILENYAAAGKSLSALDGILKKPKPPSVSAHLQAFMELLRKYESPVRKEKPWKLIESWMNDSGLLNSRCMEMLFNTAVTYDKMPAFLHNLVLGKESDLVRSGGKKYSPDSVSLMTLHGAKGLEFPVVFLCGVTEELIPFRNRSGSCNADEERRLFYVGVTRAQDELVLLTSRAPSPFLADLPAGALVTEKAFARRQASVFKQLSFFDIYAF